MKALRFTSFLELCALFLIGFTYTASSETIYEVGDQVVLVQRALGIPAHYAPGHLATYFRFDGGAKVTITAIDPETGWLEVVDDNQNRGWIIEKYIYGLSEEVEPTNVVGTWNLEWFSLNTRTDDDLRMIAEVIRDELNAKILILNEIHGEGGRDNPRAESDDLATLLVKLNELGGYYDYIITESGGSQRVAMIYDRDAALLNNWYEADIPEYRIQDQDIFCRNPLIAHFTFLQDGLPMNDLLIVGLHLASGKHRTINHDEAMASLRVELDNARISGTVCPVDEFDILVAGDLNADMFDEKVEEFFSIWDSGDFDVLAEDGYPRTNLWGSPPQPWSHLDYIIVSRIFGSQNGLQGEEINVTSATVWNSLSDAAGGYDCYEEHYSDHFPVTVEIRVMADTD
jgi:endonuclease/exonuclease/phosphatase family metal-dependent hydrolase